MTIYASDRTEARGPFALDAKVYVGDGPEYLYDTKEDIPSQYRYRGMVVYEVPASLVADVPYPVYQLQGGIADANWQLLSSGSSGSIGTAKIYPHQLTAVDGQTTFALPAGYFIDNTTIYINGVLITNNNSTTSEYDITDNVTYTNLVFTFGLEAGDSVVGVLNKNI